MSYVSQPEILFHILYIGCLITCVSDYQYDLGVKGQGKIYIKSDCMDCNANSSLFFEVGVSCLTDVCRRQVSFRITFMAFESKLKVKILKFWLYVLQPNIY